MTKEQRDANRDALLFILERMDILGDGIDEGRCIQTRPLPSSTTPPTSNRS